MVITHNITAQNAQRQFGLVSTDSRKSTEKLSSGYKINRAADDAAGLTISEKMRSQIRGLTQASDNAEDGISFVQIADGALAEVHDMLDRMVELTTKAANGTNTSEDRGAIQKEIAELTSEINRVQQSTEFNTIKTFPSNGHGLTEEETSPRLNSILPTIEVINPLVDKDGNVVTPTGATAGTAKTFQTDFTDFVVGAVADAVSELHSAYPDWFGASSPNMKLGLDTETGMGSTLAYASVTYVMPPSKDSIGYFALNMTINADTYNPANFSSWSSAQKADLAATIAHEMTHTVMYDTLATSALGSGRFEKWFIEGLAQTASGDGGWATNRLSSSSTDADYKNFMKTINQDGVGQYGSGYLATMALGYEVAKAQGLGSSYDSATIKAGLNAFLGEMANQQLSRQGTDPDGAISKLTKGKFKSLSDYMNQYKAGNADLLNDSKGIISAIGPTGAGSVLGNLSDPQSTVFNDLTNRSYNNYVLTPGTTKYNNDFGGADLNPPKKLASGGGPGERIDNGEDLILQVGAQNRTEQQITLKRFNISSDSIFDGKTVDGSTQELAKKSMDIVNDAIKRVSAVRSYYGAMQNRLEHTIKNLDNIVENTTAAESQIRDTDMAAEMVKFTKNNILMQAGQSMMAQANQSTQGVLSLLQ